MSHIKPGIRLSSKKIGEIFIDEGIITPDQLNKALKMQSMHTDVKLADILIDLGYITEEQQARALAKQRGCEFLDYNTLKLDLKLIGRFNFEDLSRYRFFPIDMDDLTMRVAVDDVFNMDIEDVITREFSRSCTVVYVTKTAMNTFIDEIVKPELAYKALDGISGVEELRKEVHDISAPTSEPMLKIVRNILYQAYLKGASDIHIIPMKSEGKNELVVKIRVDGILHVQQRVPISASKNVTNVIKNMAGMDISNSLRPLDGKIAACVGEKKLDMRVSTLPILLGEKVVIRLMDSSDNMVNLDVLGFPPEKLDTYKKMITKSQGIIFITGPTGSGKSTTLYSSLHYINDGTKNITTVENPVEYYMDDVSQSQTNEKAGLTFKTVLHSILRQDPDVIMVGEIRDKETAETAVQASNTGHLVLSTLHANDSPSSLNRLIDMGVQPFMVAESVLGILSQRLVRKLCPHCKRQIRLSEDDPIVKELNLLPSERNVFESVGCVECGGFGFKGRTTISELLVMDDELKALVSTGATTIDIKRKAIENGMITLQEDAKAKVLEGLTTFKEISKFI